MRYHEKSFGELAKCSEIPPGKSRWDQSVGEPFDNVNPTGLTVAVHIVFLMTSLVIFENDVLIFF